MAASATALPVPEPNALRVARNAIRQHLRWFGTWGGSATPRVAGIEAVEVGGDRVAYNVTVEPSGHLLIAADDELSAVLLYSDVSSFEPSRAGNPDSIESWIVPELSAQLSVLKVLARTRPTGTRPPGWEATETGRSWRQFDVPDSAFVAKPRQAQAGQTASPPGVETGSPTSVGPLLTTNWTQSAPYNDDTPGDTACAHTLAGCVAIAITQIMRYWSWPSSGIGSQSYVWTNAEGTPETLSANFNHPYSWSLMLPSLTTSSPAANINAVAGLVSDVGIAVEMEYGCSASGAVGYYAATTVLPAYFGYTTPTWAARSDYSNASAFFALIMGELNASPARPLFFTVETTDGTAGHALVIDGYQTASGEMAHLNLGWGASYQGYYNINSNWSAGGYSWSANSQEIYLGLAPAGPQYALTATLTGAGTGTVSSSPAGLDCGSICTWAFGANSTVTLSEIPSAGSHFVAWGGDCSASSTVVLSAARSCTAQFDLDDPTALPKAVDSPWLAISVQGDAGWFSETTQSVYGGSAAQSGPITDSQSSSMVTTIVGPATLSFYWKVSSEPNYDFLSLFVDDAVQPGRISGEVDWTQVTLAIAAGTHTIRWTYAKDPSVSMGTDAGWVDEVVVTYPLSVSLSGNGTGTVTSSPPGLSCGTTCSAAFPAGTAVTLSETPAAGSIFTNWTGACADMGPCTVTMNAATAVGAVFQASPVYRRYFAEGAANSFFDTRFGLLNTTTSVAHVTMRFMRDDGVNFVYLVEVPAATRRTVDATDVPGLTPATGFSTVVESDVVVVADRTMSWDSTGFGAHAEMSVPSPEPTWYLAEGSTLQLGTVNNTQIGFSLYYLIANPNSQATTVQVTYLLPGGGAPIVKNYVVSATARRTIYVNGEDPGLASTDVSAIVSSLDPTLPIIVERALYLNSGGVAFGAGSDSAGATASALDWFLAEGSTGPSFDEYILLANPTSSTAELNVTYLLTGGGTLTTQYSVAGDSRRTVWVNGEQGGGVSLATGSASAWVHSTNGVPVIVERAMWWPRTQGWKSWYETHTSIGATAMGTVWAVADGEQGGTRNVQTYILVANTSAFAGTVRVTIYFEDGTTASSDIGVAANSRTTVWMGGTARTAGSPFGGLTAGKRFGTTVESLSVGGQVANIVVERSMYWDANGVWWAAGTNVVATKLQ
jgi:hypothetical protein